MPLSGIPVRNETGRIHFDSKRLKRVTSLNASIIDITSHFARDRDKVELFIKHIYREKYNADIEVSYPVVISVRDVDGNILAASGFRLAQQESLFLEKYTNAPVEAALSKKHGQKIERHEIAEIGNLASAGNGASIFLFAALSAYLNSRSIRYAVITSTHNLAKRIEKLGLKPKLICDADPSLLTAEERSCWGSYYDTSPQVLSGSVGMGVRHLHRALGATYEESSSKLFSRLHYRYFK